MANNVKVYDPDIELDSGDSDGEIVVNDCNYDGESDDELNNTNCKVSSLSCGTTSAISFVHNNLHGSLGHLERVGGPQMNNPNGASSGGGAQASGAGASGDQSSPINVCCNCGNITMEWLEGSRFECHQHYIDDQAKLDAHNQLCRACATDEERCAMCPIHPDSYYSTFADTTTPPRVVRVFDNESPATEN